MRLVVAVGLPGSGKSTWLAQFAGNVLSTDAIREELTGDAQNQTANARVFALLRQRLEKRFADRAPVTYIDATNLTRGDRKHFIRAARAAGAAVDAIWFDTPAEVCHARNATRERKVPAHVIHQMAAKLVPPSEAEGFGLVNRVTTA